ncbi:hypothetical protein C8Q78DRAFT_1052580 [Trametes maxima]|nr:hypothetical protein C8Q78DRAFT_1052580 [Trametes maxima]
MDSGHFGLVCCATSHSLPRLAEAFSCFLLALTAQELPYESVTLHSFPLNPFLTPYSLC